MRRVVVVVAALLLVGGLASMTDGFSGRLEVCTICGSCKATNRIFWITSSEVQATELSRFRDEALGHEAHDHHWLFGSGGSGKFSCMIGDGRHLFAAVHDEQSRQALELIRQEGDEVALPRWVERLLDPKLSRSAMTSLRHSMMERSGNSSIHLTAESTFRMFEADDSDR